jgi:hypothetical protein
MIDGVKEVANRAARDGAAAPSRLNMSRGGSWDE